MEMKKYDLENAKINSNGNITITDIQGSEININLGNTKELSEFMNSISEQLELLPKEIMKTLLEISFNLHKDHRLFSVEVDGFVKRNKSKILNPKFLRTEKNFKVKTLDEKLSQIKVINPMFSLVHTSVSPFGASKINHGLCRLQIQLTNIGDRVLDDWKLILYFDKNEVQEIRDGFTTNVFEYERMSKYRTTFTNEKENSILCKPIDNKPLIQSDSIVFECLCIPQYSAAEVNVLWKLLARDFNTDGSLIFNVEPTFKIEEKTIWVNNSKSEKKEIIISDYITEK